MAYKKHLMSDEYVTVQKNIFGKVFKSNEFW